MDLFDETAKVCMRTTIVVAVPDTHVQAQEALPNHPPFWKQLTLKGQTPDAICLDGYIGKSVPIVLRWRLIVHDTGRVIHVHSSMPLVPTIQRLREVDHTYVALLGKVMDTTAGMNMTGDML